MSSKILPSSSSNLILPVRAPTNAPTIDAIGFEDQMPRFQRKDNRWNIRASTGSNLICRIGFLAVILFLILRAFELGFVIGGFIVFAVA
jgi:hypothetical protein